MSAKSRNCEAKRDGRCEARDAPRILNLKIYLAGMKQAVTDTKSYKLGLYKVTSVEETNITFDINEYIQAFSTLMDSIKIMIVKIINLLPRVKRFYNTNCILSLKSLWLIKLTT
jgi:hypothetical protein